MGFNFHELLSFQNLGSFVQLKKGYDESQIKAFYCNAQWQNGVSFECAFKNIRVSLNLEKWDSLVHLDCNGVDIEVKDTFTNYNKIDFVKSVSKTGFGELSFSNFSLLQLKCANRMLHWGVVKIIMSKQHNYGRIDDYDLSIMWLLKNKIKVNGPLFFSNRMISYKNDGRKKLPYPSFISCLLRSDHVTSVDTLLTIPSEVSGLDAKAVQKMHYAKDSKGNWYYDDNGVWYYDFTAMAEGTNPELVEKMKENMEKEDCNIENDVETEDGEETSDDDEDLDCDPENDDYLVGNQNHSSESPSEVLLGINDLKKYMSQKFDAQDLQFKEINKRFDAQDLQFKDINIRLDYLNASIQEMRESIQKWNDLGVSTDAFFASLCPDQDEIDGITNPTEPKA